MIDSVLMRRARSRIRKRRRRLAEPQNSSKYWHDEKLQQEYLSLIGGLQQKYRNLYDGASHDAAEALGATEDFTSRMALMSEEIGDTAGLDASFEGLSDAAQSYAAAALADPSKREAYINSMPVETLEELIDFVGRMPEHEQAALERALLL